MHLKAQPPVSKGLKRQGFGSSWPLSVFTQLGVFSIPNLNFSFPT